MKQYIIITLTYWAFTLTDGALRMLIVLYFHSQGYGALDIALLFVFYEVFGVITNLYGGWLGAKWGLNRTMLAGLLLQMLALSMLLQSEWITFVWVMIAQALSGIAKDLNKMSAKSSIKLLLPSEAKGRLFRWIALLTGSKNALKGAGFFIGGLLLSLVGFSGAITGILIFLTLSFILSLIFLSGDLGRSTYKPKFKELISKSSTINALSAARLFLFGARDVWFVIAVPVYFQTVLGWGYEQVGAFMALWIILYGIVQSCTPLIVGDIVNPKKLENWALLLSMSPIVLILGLTLLSTQSWVLVVGLFVFGAIFAVNASLHSFMIVDLARADGVSLDVGFYYMANAMGRLLGTVLSGAIFQYYGLLACLLVSSLFILVAYFFTRKLSNESKDVSI
jgi:predicted MFS family arabinose efflux permease